MLVIGSGLRPRALRVFGEDHRQVDPASDSPAASERVMVVEDDPATRAGLSELIRTWGFLTEAAADGEEALGKVTSLPIWSCRAWTDTGCSGRCAMRIPTSAW
jgi:PleD family two-component response regulator